MATDAAGSNIALINALSSLPKTLFGSSSNEVTTGGGTTSTRQTMLSQDAINALLRGMMEKEEGGLAKIASSSRIPGLYNSTTQQLMINDLMARSAAEVAKAGAPTVTTERQTAPIARKVETPGVMSGTVGKGLALAGGAAYLSSDKGKKQAKSAVDSVTSSLGMGTITGGTAVAAADPIAAMGAVDFLNPAVAADTGGVFNLAQWAAAPDTAISAASAAPELMGAFSGANAGISDLMSFSGGPLEVAGLPIGDALPYLPAVGQLASGDVGGAAVTAGLTYAGTAIGGPIGGVIGSVVGSILGGGGGGGGCFITTAVCRIIGAPDDCYELRTLRAYRDGWLQENRPQSITQYYDEAPAIVEKLDARDDAAKIYHSLYRDYIAPAIRAIEQNANELAYEIYSNMFHHAKEIANG